MARRFGIPPATAIEQAQKVQEVLPTEAFQPLPAPTGQAPFRVTTEQLGVPAASGARVFHCLGDSGGVSDPNPQIEVVNAMVADLQANPEIAFAWHVGDIAYYNGEQPAWLAQFFEAYAHYNRTILGHPGNHDADPLPGSVSLAEWMQIMCSSSPAILAGTEEYQRDTQTLPNVYFTLLDPAVTIVGLYSNVPSGGVIEQDQADWLAGEVAAAPADLPLIVSLHHPPYSADAYHGGSAKMGAVLDAAFEKAGRWPALVLTGHVHNYQRFQRTLPSGKQVTYIVNGAGGYRNLHSMASGAAPGLQVTADTVLKAFDATTWGYLTLTVTSGQVSGTYTQVTRDGQVTSPADSFTC